MPLPTQVSGCAIAQPSGNLELVSLIPIGARSMTMPVSAEPSSLPQIPGYSVLDSLYTGSKTAVYRAVTEGKITKGAVTEDVGTTGVTTEGKPQSVVIKVLSQAYPSVSELTHFRNQYAITKNLSIPGIVKLIALEPWQNSYALIMEDFGGTSLQQYAADQSLSVIETLGIALQMADILHDLGQHHIIHKDIKPANILIQPSSKRIQLIDFSIASLLPKETQTVENPNGLQGSLAYLAPEQTGRMNRGIDYRADFYSLGITLYELLTGGLPFSATDPLELIHAHIAKCPVPPDQHKPEIPRVLSQIVLKLMAKNAEDRYQSALGLKHDLEQCLYALKETGEVVDFELGRRDVSDRFLIPDKLYGREPEVEKLLAAFERVTKGRSELMLIAGSPGVGKTAVVNEVHKPITQKHGHFIKGKYDPFNRQVPFSAFVQAFRNLVGQLLSESDSALTHWKTQILEALGDKGQVIIDVIPELETIIGKQPAVHELAGSAAQNRFYLLFGQFVRTFAQKEHPLILFLDDLQWADSASLQLLNSLITDSSAGYLLLLGAYRDTEVSPGHPLSLALKDIQRQGIAPKTLHLLRLTQRDITHLMADTLRCPADIAQPSAQLIYQKTRGNPFFTTQFLQEIYEENCISFSPDTGYWQCDLSQMQALAITDNVVEFMVSRLGKLPTATQDTLKLAACIGNQFETATLAMVHELSPQTVADNLTVALQEGFILPIQTLSQVQTLSQAELAEQPQSQIEIAGAQAYRFAHDRIQQAAYSLVSESLREATHRAIGQQLLAQTSEYSLDERIFEIANQLNQGTGLGETDEARETLIQINLKAGKRALNTTAYSVAIHHFECSITLLPKDHWQSQYTLSLHLFELMAEAAYMNGDFQAATSYIRQVVQNAQSVLDQVNIGLISIQLQIAKNQPLLAIETALSLLKKLGVVITLNPDESAVMQAVNSAKQALENKKIEQLVDLPLNQNAEKLAIIKILGNVHSAIFFAAPQLTPIEICTRTALCIQHGNSAETAHSYADYGLLLCGVWNDIERGYAFGQLALAIAERFPQSGVQARAKIVTYLTISHWKQPLRSLLSPLLLSYQEALETGDLEFAAYGIFALSAVSFLAGERLPQLSENLADYSQAAAKTHQGMPLCWVQIYQQSVFNLTHFVEHPWLLKGEYYNEVEKIPQQEKASALAGLFNAYSQKAALAYLFEHYTEAYQYTNAAQKTVNTVTAMVVQPSFFFYDSLIRLEQCSTTTDCSSLLERVEENQAKMKLWGHHCPDNYLHKYHLVEAKKHQVLEQYDTAIESYDLAITAAKASAYIQEEALANELAAKFYLAWGKPKLSALYMQGAYYCYARWGATTKTQYLEKQYSELLSPILQEGALSFNPLDTISTIYAPQSTIHEGAAGSPGSTRINTALDFAAVMKASQALSGTIELNDLLRQLTQIILQQSGGDYCALILTDHEGHCVLKAIANADNIDLLSQPMAKHLNLPLKLLNYVKHTSKTVVIDKLETDLPVIDDYLTRTQPKSVLCLPLLNQGQLLGLLYLQNQSTRGVFTQDRLQVLNFLCTQAAISLENARLYQQSQAYAKQLEDAQLQTVQSEKMASLGNLVAGVAHEINNPIGFLNGSLRNAQDYAKDLIEHLSLIHQHHPQTAEAVQENAEEIDLDFLCEDLPKLLASMKGANQRIKSISTSLRTFSRADTEYKVSTDLHEGLDSTLLILKYRLKANEHRPAIEVVKNYGELPIVACFPGQLNQVFMNLLANAIDVFDEAIQGLSYAELEKSPQIITVTTLVVEKTWVEVRIRDNGKGMPEAIKAKIFDHLFTTKAVGKGTGLGLAIARKIITEAHDGRLEVASTVGKGTEFIITLPISETT